MINKEIILIIIGVIISIITIITNIPIYLIIGLIIILISSFMLNNKKIEEKVVEKIITKEIEKPIETDNILEETHINTIPDYEFNNSPTYKTELKKIRAEQKNMIKNNTATKAEEWTVDGSRSKGQKMMKNNIKQILRTFNTECDLIINKVTITNITSSEGKIRKSYASLNRINQTNRLSLTESYLNLKIRELKLNYEYTLKKQEEKDLLREEREKERENKKIMREIQKQQKELNKNEKTLTKELEKIQEQYKTAETEELKIKIRELTAALEKNKEKQEKLNDKEKHPTAGYVYIISNIGSFGKEIYKIGVTRRDKPEDRVNELSSASVPFRFDIHVLIFSKDAYSLENTLHNRFHNKRVNKVNNRKEFFNISRNDVESIVNEFKKDVVSYNLDAPAVEYNESLKIR